MMQEKDGGRSRRVETPDAAHRGEPEVLFALRKMRLAIVGTVARENKLSSQPVTREDVVVRRLVRDLCQDRLYAGIQLRLGGQRDLVELPEESRGIGRAARFADDHAENRLVGGP